MLQVHITINKAPKFGKSDGGDTVEVVERPQGGFSIILADGQGSGSGAKRISALVVNKAIALIGDGARDGAVARAAHDYLYTLRHGKVSAELNILSIDLQSRTLVVSRNSRTPVLVCMGGGEIYSLEEEAPPIGVYPLIRPDIHQFSLEENLRAAVFSDGFINAGHDSSKVYSILKEGLGEEGRPLQELGEEIFNKVMASCQFRPKDDMTLSLLAIKAASSPDDRVKRYSVSFPL